MERRVLAKMTQSELIAFCEGQSIGYHHGMGIEGNADVATKVLALRGGGETLYARWGIKMDDH